VRWIKDEDIESMANSKFFGLPSFGYVDKSLNMGGQGALLGDAIHTVKPYFGLGVNSAWEDVKVLVEALDDANGDTSVALPHYSKKRAADAKALVDLSRSFDGGFMTFVLPLIVDSIFNKVAPWLFMPNTIQMLQREEWSFSAIAKRKWLDRFMQGTVIMSFMSAVGYAALQLTRQYVWPFVARALLRGGA
jgi:flavin-dependent dehydrogenase